MTIEPPDWEQASYQFAHDGYRYRDQLVPQEFHYMLQAFLTLLGLMAGAKALLPVHLAVPVIVLVLFSGFLALGGFLIDLESNASCKGALREYMQEIERRHNPNGHLGGNYWETIAKRSRFWEERHYKDLCARAFQNQSAGAATNVFANAARGLFCAWITIGVLIVVLGIYSLLARV